MNRLCKKSDSTKGQVRQASALTSPLSHFTEKVESSQVSLITNDFRASLILPELSRRFSLLRSSAGDSFGIEVLRTKLRDQRARGAEHQISEEEEEMIFRSFLPRSKHSTSPSGHSNSPCIRHSHKSTNSLASSSSTSISSSPDSWSPRHCSDKIFGSERFRDHTYIENVIKNGKNRPWLQSDHNQANASTPDDGRTSPITDQTLEPSVYSNLSRSSPNVAKFGSAPEHYTSTTVGPSGLMRSSLALQEVIKEIEDDQIIIRGIDRPSICHSKQNSATTEGLKILNTWSSSSDSKVVEKGFENQACHIHGNGQRSSPVPSRTLPGYIPGMPRPMTPRDPDLNYPRSYSTTPRSSSPNGSDSTDTSTTLRPITSSFRSESRSLNAPLFLQRSTNGCFTPEETGRTGPSLLSAPNQPNPEASSSVVWNIRESNKQPHCTTNGSFSIQMTEIEPQLVGYGNISPRDYNLGDFPSLTPSGASRLSLDSEGSSYHTWDGEHKNQWMDLIFPSDAPNPAWHDLSNVSSMRESEYDDWDPEEFILRHAGLQKTDFEHIHEKLLNVSLAKEDRQERTASSLRRQRRSISQSEFIVEAGGAEKLVTCPNTRTQIPVAKEPIVALKSLSPCEQTDTIPPSPNTLRNRDLAMALFGKENDQVGNVVEGPIIGSLNVDALSPSMSVPQNLPHQYTEHFSRSKVPHFSQQEAKFVQEVQKRVDAANSALKSPAKGSLMDVTISRKISTSRKRIDPNQISNPRLVSASSSVETFPIVRAHSVSSSANWKTGFRLKRLRGTLKGKNLLSMDEYAPSASSVRVTHSDAARLTGSGNPPASTGTAQRFKVAVPSPPATAAPGLKGFMSRLRGLPRNSESHSQSEIHVSHLPHFTFPDLPPQCDSKNSFQTINDMEYTSCSSNAPLAETNSPHKSTQQESGDTLLLKQFFEAANKVGIDQKELNTLLARKGSLAHKSESTSTKTFASSVDSNASATPSGDEQSTWSITPGFMLPEHANEKSTHQDQLSQDHSTWQRSLKLQDLSLLQEKRSDSRASSAIVRRTIIFPDSKMSIDELTSLMGKNSSGRRRGSFTSTSSHSIYDRIPTPSRSTAFMRFSSGLYPPLPTFPSNLSSPTLIAFEKPNDSPVAVNAVDTKYMCNASSRNHNDHDARNGLPHVAESGAGVEVIQLANGETIWNIINGLRCNDGESVYYGRGSFDSELSAEGVQVFVKELRRSCSQGSVSSLSSRRKALKRPETQVFYSPSSNIGRLIEDLSLGMDAGSFNFSLTDPLSHSPSSSMSTNDVT